MKLVEQVHILWIVLLSPITLGPLLLIALFGNKCIYVAIPYAIVWFAVNEKLIEKTRSL